MKLSLTTSSTLIATLLMTSSGFPQHAIAHDALELPLSPTLEGSGEQTQSVHLLQDRVSVTVNSGGGVNTSTSERGIDLNGHLSVGIKTPLDDVGLDAGSPAETAATPDDTSQVPPGEQVENHDASSRTTETLDCFDHQIFGSTLTAPAISQMGEGTHLTILLHCASSVEMTADQGEALVNNPHLMQMLDRAQINPDKVVALTVAENGSQQIHIIR